MIFKIKTDDKVAGIVIEEALSNAGIQHTIISKTDDYDQFTLIQRHLDKGPETNGWKSDELFALYESYAPGNIKK